MALPLVGLDVACLVSCQILQKVLQGCRENMLGTMALAACQFMEEPGMEVQVRESKHPYNNNTNFEVRSRLGQARPASGHAAGRSSKNLINSTAALSSPDSPGQESASLVSAAVRDSAQPSLPFS